METRQVQKRTSDVDKWGEYMETRQVQIREEERMDQNGQVKERIVRSIKGNATKAVEVVAFPSILLMKFEQDT